jgi:hypothetical protein
MVLKTLSRARARPLAGLGAEPRNKFIKAVLEDDILHDSGHLKIKFAAQNLMTKQQQLQYWRKLIIFTSIQNKLNKFPITYKHHSIQ